MLGDKGMLMSVQCVLPFKGKAAASEDHANFNTQHARLWIVAEQVIGQVKARFGSLRELRVQMERISDVTTCGKWIIAAFVLHNICVEQKDYFTPRDRYAFRSANNSTESDQSGAAIEAAKVRQSLLKGVIDLMKKDGNYVEK